MTEQPENDADATESDEPTVLETWTSPFGIERDKRMVQLQAMPGFRLNLDLAALGRAGHIMYRNAEELSRHATDYLTGRRFSQDVDDEFENELVRYLHNYLTSVTSLIDSQRVVMRHCWGKDSEFEKGAYTEQRKVSFETGEAEFMKDLRNYCTHRAAGGRKLCRPSIVDHPGGVRETEVPISLVDSIFRINARSH